MKKQAISLIVFTFLLSGCFFSNNNNPSSSNNSSYKEEITSFDFVTDTMMTQETNDDGSQFYKLTIYVDETYQIKTNVDDKIGNDYYFQYSDFDTSVVDISSTGLVTAMGRGVDTVKVGLYRRSDSKKIHTKYFVANVKEVASEYANITINDSTLDYDEETRTYSLTLNGGESYHINTSVSYNVSYNKIFALTDESYSSFMNVDSNGSVTTQHVTEDQDGKIEIKTISEDGSKVYDTIYLAVHVHNADEPVVKQLEVTNLSSGEKLSNGDNLSLFVHESIAFGIEYGEENQYGVTTVSNNEVLELDNDTNTITGLAAGTSDVTFMCEDKSLTIHVEVSRNTLTEIYSKNGSDDFVIINGNLLFLGRMFAKYLSGDEIDITKSSDLTFVIADAVPPHKSVTFTYIDGSDTQSVTYSVVYLVGEEYVADSTNYNMADYFSNHYQDNCFVLPNEGTIHMLVIPIWFTNSTNFFRENQKDEILADLEYVYNSERDKDNFHSVKQFYEKESSGKLVLNITISEFYESGTSSTSYGDTVESDKVNTHNLADHAIQWYFNNHTDESIDDYDSNGDGLADAVSLVYAANYYGTIGDANGSTAFQFKNNKGSTHRYNNGSFSPIGGIYGFNKTSDPSKQLEAEDLSTYYPSYYFTTGCRTIIHETGHMFGFADLYEDNHAETKYYPAGTFSMQDYNVGGHDPYQMNLVGWSQPQIYDASNYDVGDSITVKIDDFASSGDNILLTRDMNEYNSLFDEYMLLELLAPTGLNYYDAKNSPFSFKDAGIRLWHVNSILEDYSNSEKETSEISNETWVNLKYSNNDQSSEYDLAHWIRNNVEETYDTISTIKDSYGLFKTGDHFDMDSYSSQFVNPGKLDNKEKLGWEFTVDSVYKTVDDEYGAIITLARVENTRVDFDFGARLDKDIATQPTVDGNDYAEELLGDDELFSLIYNFNDATAPAYYTQGKPISYKGLCLFASPNGNGGSLVISINDKDGYVVKINSISITYSMLTKASVTAVVGGDTITGTSFTGPYNDYDEYNEAGLTFEVNNDSITIQNRYTEGTDYWSVLAIYSVSINYHMEKI